MKPSPPSVRRQARSITALALVVLISASTLLASPYLRQNFALSDLSTAHDERRSERLSDGSQINLNASSAVDLQFNAQHRGVNLLEGEMLVEVAHDPQRPFYITTAEGSIRTLGTRLIVERLEDTTLVTLLDADAQVDSGGRSQILSAGQRLRFDTQGPGALQQVDSLGVQAAWNAHQLLANDQPLSEVLERLARHRKGLVIFDKTAMSALRVTLMLPTDDSDLALRMLARTLPVEVRQYTPWLTLVSLTPDHPG